MTEPAINRRAVEQPRVVVTIQHESVVRFDHVEEQIVIDEGLGFGSTSASSPSIFIPLPTRSRLN